MYKDVYDNKGCNSLNAINIKLRYDYRRTLDERITYYYYTIFDQSDNAYLSSPVKI